MRIPTGHLSMQRHLKIACIALCAVVMLLAACGQPSAPGQGTATAATTLTGCPAPTQTVTWPTPIAVTITPPFSTSAVTVHAGQAVEAVFPFGHLWSFTAGSEQPALALDTPAGYGDSGMGRCVWHFTARQAGHVVLTFTMQALCPPHTSCPLYIAILKAPVLVVSS